MMTFNHVSLLMVKDSCKPLTRVLIVVSMLLAVHLTSGCGRYGTPASTARPEVETLGTAARDEPEHLHKLGPHAGTVISLNEDAYHLEAAFSSDNTIAVYCLADDETKLMEVDQQLLTGYMTLRNRDTTELVLLRPVPLAGDTPNKTSRFVATLPETTGKVADLQSLTIPGLRIRNERFIARFVFTAVASPTMPVAVQGDALTELYGVAGGLYSEADIEANGNTTPQQKFVNFRAQHDFNPRAGDPICPITRTKANPSCTWVIKGQTYSFCCPPCIDEFVQLAKDSPDQIKDAEDYRY